MQRIFIALFLMGSLVLARESRADGAGPRGHVVKVLPLLLNLKGHDAISPSLFDGDAYQFYLRVHTNQISGIRYDVQWKASKITTKYVDVMIELRAVAADGSPRMKILAQAERPRRFGNWTSLPLVGDDYKKLGSVVAWRASVWSGNQMLGEQHSFLW